MQPMMKTVKKNPNNFEPTSLVLEFDLQAGAAVSQTRFFSPRDKFRDYLTL